MMVGEVIRLHWNFFRKKINIGSKQKFIHSRMKRRPFSLLSINLALINSQEFPPFNRGPEGNAFTPRSPIKVFLLGFSAFPPSQPSSFLYKFLGSRHIKGAKIVDINLSLGKTHEENSLHSGADITFVFSQPRRSGRNQD